MLWNYLVILTWKWRTILKMNDQRKADLIKLIMGFFFFFTDLSGEILMWIYEKLVQQRSAGIFSLLWPLIKVKEEKKKCIRWWELQPYSWFSKAKSMALHWLTSAALLLPLQMWNKSGVNSQSMVWMIRFSCSLVYVPMRKRKKKKRKTVQRLRGARKRWAVG